MERDIGERAEWLADRLARMQRITSRLVTAVTAEEIAAALTDSLAMNGTGWCGVWLAHGRRLVLTGADRDLRAARLRRHRRRHRRRLSTREYRPGGAAALPRSRCARPARRDGGLIPAGGAAVVPIVLRDECLGVLVVTYPGAKSFDREETDFLSALVDQAAQSLDRTRLHAAQAALAKVNAFLAEAAQVLAEAADFGDTLERLAGVALDALGDICLIDVLADTGQVTRMVARHRDPLLQPLVNELKLRHSPELPEVHPALDVIHTGHTRWGPEMTDDFLRQTTHDADHFALVKTLGFRSYLAVPLLTGDEALGSLTLVSTSRAFGLDDVHFAERLAQQVAAVVGNARRYDATLRTSHILQQSLLPQKLPNVAGLEIHTRYLPATRGLEIGGDFYDVIVVPSGRIGFMIGDVAGHDRDAAAAMGHLRSAARALSGQVHTPAALVNALQWSWDLIGIDRIATGTFGRLDPTNGDLIMASAGHYPPLVVDTESARFLPIVPSAPLGAPGTEAVNWEGTLRSGQLLLLYTDGVLDERHTGYARGMDRLAAIAAGGDLHPEAVCERIVATLPPDRTDDVALLALRIPD